MALAGAMIAGACSSTETTTIATDAAAASTDDGDGSSIEFDPVDAEPATTQTPTPPPTPPASDPTSPAPTTTPGPLITPTPIPAATTPPRPISTCPNTTVPEAVLFVWDVADDDPDGGLVAHTDADVDSPITRVLPPNALAVRPTGNCKPAPNDAPWFELYDPATDRFDWVNARYLAPAAPACLHGEAVGAATRGGVRAGTTDTQLFGPIEGVARAEGELVAFIPHRDQLVGQAAPELGFRWYPAESVTVDVPCFLEGPTGPVCLSGTVLIFDFVDHSPRVNDDVPLDVVRTGRLYARPSERGLRDEFVEVSVDGDPGRYWYDPATTQTGAAPCPADGSAPADNTGAAAFGVLACTVGSEGTNASVLSAGSPASNADHVHRISTAVDPDSGCVRVVIDLGTGIWSDAERPTNSLPPTSVTKDSTSTWIAIEGLEGHALAEPGSHTLASYGVRAFVADTNGIGVEVLHPPAATNVTFLENPARVIIDLQAEPGAERSWYGLGPTVAEPLPTDIAANVAFTVEGWDRPFEAQGQWRIYRVDDLISFEPQTPLKLDNYLASDLDLVASGLYMTTGWTTAWGAFDAELPGLDPGIYAVLVGSTSPNDDAPYLAAGQVVRVYDDGVDPETLPELPEQRWDSIAISD